MAYSALNRTNIYRVTFKHGVMSPIMLDADTEDEAKREALAAYRKNCTHMSDLTIDQIIDEVNLISEN